MAVKSALLLSVPSVVEEAGKLHEHRAGQMAARGFAEIGRTVIFLFRTDVDHLEARIIGYQRVGIDYMRFVDG